MAKGFDFKDTKTAVKDSDGDSHDHSVSAARVTKDNAGEVRTRGGVRTVVPGDVLVTTDAPDVYDVLTSDQWKATGYSSGPPEKPDQPPTSTPAKTPERTPAK